ncbi:hypothetical protein [Pectobacterium brasiliense]|uniref:hypothetical protein n=1 Tax=Pectobacterium brasiliense TaxID=180957 RepID=UPI000CE6947A|nr:hypothetical protein [Pectobacterium brasiliense]PPE64197.1 hypothetical protein F152LOC_00987 [Pectobacterium brasiliense]
MAKLYGLDSSLIHDAKPNEGFVIDMVRASDYLELERQRDALVAELSSLKSFSDRLVDMHNGLNGSGGGIYDEDSITYQQAALSAAMDAFDEIKTPTTDSALREIGAKAVEKCAETLLGNDDISVDYEYSAIRAFAQQLREGKV